MQQLIWVDGLRQGQNESVQDLGEMGNRTMEYDINVTAGRGVD